MPSSSDAPVGGTSSPRSPLAKANNGSVRDRGAAVDSSGKDADEPGAVAAKLWSSVAETVQSSYQSQESLDGLCKKYGIPTEFAPLLAGERRACSAPPKGAVCVYAHALEAGMRVPLDPFFSEVLNYFGIAPSQLTPNGWRILVGFLVLSHSACVPPSLPVFRHFFFTRSVSKSKGWYCFGGKDAAGALLFKLGPTNDLWKQDFFFLSSPDGSWPCPEVWGQPSKSSVIEPVLDKQEKKWAAMLLRARGAAAVDLGSYLCDSNVAAATNASAVVDAVEVKTEPIDDTPELDWPPSSKKKRKVSKDKATAAWDWDEMLDSDLNTPPGIPPQKNPPENGGNDRSPLPLAVTCEEAQPDTVLRDIVTLSRTSKFTAAKPSDVVASSYVKLMEAADYATFSFGYVLELQKKLGEREREAAELQKRLGERDRKADELQEKLSKRDRKVADLREKLKNAKEVAAAEAKSARVAAVQQYLGSKEHQRRLDEHAMEVCKKGLEQMQRERASTSMPPDN